MTIGIVGLGLMSGSMAKSIKVKTGHNVFGSDTNAKSLLSRKTKKCFTTY